VGIDPVPNLLRLHLQKANRGLLPIMDLFPMDWLPW
jgi:hypothetical protein